MADPRCAELETLLVTLTPRQELVRRWAPMTVYRPCATDSMWKGRIRVLLDGLKLDEDGLTSALREANDLAAELSPLGQAAPKPRPVD